MAYEVQKPLEGLELSVLIALQTLSYAPPKKWEQREGYEKKFAKDFVEKLRAAGWEFKHTARNTWTGVPQD